MDPVDQIKKDIPRTRCTSRKRLFWILSEYSKIDTHLGYTQGMNYTCALIIDTFPRYSAKKQLQIFKNLLNIPISRDFTVRDMYTNGFPGLIFLIESLKQTLDTDIKRVLNDSCIELEHFVPQWFLTLFTCQLSQTHCKKMLKQILKTQCFDTYVNSAKYIITECIKQSDFLEWILLDTQFEQLLSRLKEFTIL
jgi:hypothetical protein